MNKVIESLDELFVDKNNHSKVLIDFEDKDKNVKLTYKENKGYGNKSVIIYFKNGNIVDLRTNYDLSKLDRTQELNNETILDIAVKLLEEAVK